MSVTICLGQLPAPYWWLQPRPAQHLGAGAGASLPGPGSGGHGSTQATPASLDIAMNDLTTRCFVFCDVMWYGWIVISALSDNGQKYIYKYLTSNLEYRRVPVGYFEFYHLPKTSYLNASDLFLLFDFTFKYIDFRLVSKSFDKRYLVSKLSLPFPLLITRYLKIHKRKSKTEIRNGRRKNTLNLNLVLICKSKNGAIVLMLDSSTHPLVSPL